ncbi:MAG: hypothetical protein ACRDTA_21985 [Pseudonocardiaceae bacterium]
MDAVPLRCPVTLPFTELLREPSTTAGRLRATRRLRRILPQAQPWVTFLPTKAVDELVEEVATLQAAASIDSLWPVSQLLVEWRRKINAQIRK